MEAFPPEEIEYQTRNRNDSRSLILVAVSSVFTGLATISFILRVIARKVTKVGFGWDDYLSFAAIIALIGLTVSTCLGKCVH